MEERKTLWLYSTVVLLLKYKWDRTLIYRWALSKVQFLLSFPIFSSLVIDWRWWGTEFFSGIGMKNSQWKIWGFLSNRSWNKKVLCLDIRKMKNIKMYLFSHTPNFICRHFLCRSLKSVYFYLYTYIFFSLSLPPSFLIPFFKKESK